MDQTISTIKEKKIKHSTFQKSWNIFQRSELILSGVTDQGGLWMVSFMHRQAEKLPLAMLRKKVGQWKKSHLRRHLAKTHWVLLHKWLSHLMSQFPQPQNEENTFFPKLLWGLEIMLVKHGTADPKVDDIMSCNYIKQQMNTSFK